MINRIIACEVAKEVILIVWNLEVGWLQVIISWVFMKQSKTTF